MDENKDKEPIKDQEPNINGPENTPKIMSMTNINIGVVIKMMMGFLRVALRVS